MALPLTLAPAPAPSLSVEERMRKRKSRSMSTVGMVCLLSVALRAIAADPTPEQLEFFEKKIRPVLADNCYSCHSAKAEKLKGGLLLDTKAGVLKGGDTGPALVPGNPDASLLIKAVRYGDANLQMPP